MSIFFKILRAAQQDSTLIQCITRRLISKVPIIPGTLFITDAKLV